MQKKPNADLFYVKKRLQHFTIVKKCILIGLFILGLTPESISQSSKISINLQDATLIQVIKELEKQSDMGFVYDYNVVKKVGGINLNLKEVSLEKVLKEALKSSSLTYSINNSVVVLSEKGSTPTNTKEDSELLTVSGKVIDEDGLPLPGATVLIKGTYKGITTDKEGDYAIKVPGSNTVLVFSFVGFKSREIRVDEQTIIDVTLEQSVTELDDVVVIGYGTLEKAKITSSIAKVTAKEIENIPATGIDEVMQGQVAGVQITSGSGMPGGGVLVRIRGQNSILAGNDPLYVVDGVPVVSGSLAGSLDDIGNEYNALSNLNPEDIASIEILKDAGATAIYGSRGANGVILITTKRGKPGRTNVSVDIISGFSQATNFLDVLNAEQYREIKTEAYINDGLPVPDYLTNVNSSINTNWQDEVSRTAFISQYQLSMDGGNDKTTFYLGAGYRDEEAIVKNADFKRGNFRLNLNHRVNQKLKIGTQIGISRYITNGFIAGAAASNIIDNAIISRPDFPVRDENGDYTAPLLLYGFFKINPVEELLEPKKEAITTSINGNIYLDYKLFPGLSFRTDASYDYQIFEWVYYIPSTTFNGQFNNGYAINALNQSNTYNIEPRLRFQKSFGETHNMDVILGSTFSNRVNKSNKISGRNFINDELNYLISAGEILQVPLTSSTRTDYAFNSIFGRISYDYDGKYLLSATLRRDGSSRFGKESRYGTFWALSGGWVFTKAASLKDSKWLDFGKLRISYGITGNDLIGDYAGFDRWTVNSGFDGTPGIAPTQLGNPALKWEETTKFDIGLDLSLFNERVDITMDYYINRTSNLLLNKPIQSITGFGSIVSNIGKTENKGFEFSFSTVNIKTNDFSWTTRFNISKIKNRIVSLVDDDPIMLYGGFTGYFVNEPINIFYGFDFLEVDPQTGNAVYRDLNDDGVINNDDKTIIGNALPDFYGGMSNTFSWKGFTLDIFLQFVGNVDVLDFSALTGYYRGGVDANNQSVDILKRWQKPGDITDVPRVTTWAGAGLNNRLSDRFVWDASYLRIKNITLSYNLPSKITDKLGIHKARIYVTGTNLFTFTNYKGLDPEAIASDSRYVGSHPNKAGPASGIINASLPQVKMIILGARLTF